MLDHDRPNWSVEGRDWPNRAHSRFVAAGGLSWHVQRMGAGPKLLMLHGTGASTHSFRDLAPLLAEDFDLLAPDLPGHGFTAMPGSSGLSLEGMARAVGALLKRVDFDPDIVLGHSAGAAILMQMALGGLIAPRCIVAVNGALMPIRCASLFSPLAKLLFLNPLAPRLFARRALGRDAVRRLLEGTGSVIDQRGLELYQRLFSNSGHVAGTLGMMANWDLRDLQHRMQRLDVPVVLVTAAFDRSVPPGDARVAAARLKRARVIVLPAGGHLVHEEHPERIAAIVSESACEATSSPSGEETVCKI
jgi:magnesium chelatase accessory protein